MKVLAIGMTAALVGCGPRAALCEVPLDSTIVCIDAPEVYYGTGDGLTDRLCETLGGTATRLDAVNIRPTCASIGYPQDCGSYRISTVEEGEVTLYAFAISDAADCETAASEGIVYIE